MAQSKVSIEKLIEELVVAFEQELERLRHEAGERAQEAGRGAALVGTAGALAHVSAGALGSLPILALRRVLPAPAIAFTLAGGSAVGAAVLAPSGVARLAAIAPKALEQEVEEVVGNVADAAR